MCSPCLTLPACLLEAANTPLTEVSREGLSVSAYGGLTYDQRYLSRLNDEIGYLG